MFPLSLLSRCLLPLSPCLFGNFLSSVSPSICLATFHVHWVGYRQYELSLTWTYCWKGQAFILELLYASLRAVLLLDGVASVRGHFLNPLATAKAIFCSERRGGFVISGASSPLQKCKGVECLGG